MRSCSKSLRQGKCLVGTDSRASSLADWSRGGGHSKGHDDRACTGTSRHGSTRMSCKSSCRLQRQRRCPRILSTTTRVGRAPDLDGRFYTPEYETLFSVKAELVDETYGNNIKRMQDSKVNFLRWTYQNRVSRALNSKNRKGKVFPPGTYVYCWRKVERETERIIERYCSSPLHRNLKRH